MKNILVIYFLVLSFFLVSCNSGSEEEAKKLKSQREMDSLREDSLSRAEAESMMEMGTETATGDTAKKDSVAVK